MEHEVESYLRRRFEGRVERVEQLAKEDLGLVRALATPRARTAALRAR